MLVTWIFRTGRIAVLAFAALVAASPAFGTAFRNDNSGLYNAVGESGWAVQFEQQGDAITATIYTYDSNMVPIWYSATLLLGINPYPWSDLWAGDLYATTGPWFGAPFDASKIGYRKVGTINFVQEFTDGGTVTFTIDGVEVTKHIQRWTFRLDNYAGTYCGMYKVIASCGNPPVDSTSYIDTMITVTQAANSLTVVTNEASGNSCTFSGDYTQSGQYGQSVGNFACTNGLVGFNGTLPFYYEMNVTTTDFRARFNGSRSDNCSIYGNVFRIPRFPSN